MFQKIEFKKKCFFISLAIVGFIFLVKTNSVQASVFDFWSDTGGAETVEFLKKYEDWLSYGQFLTVTFTWVGWAVIKSLFWLSSLVEGLIPETFNLLNFLDNSGLNSLTSAIIKDLVLALMVLTLVYLGFKTIIAKEPPKFKNIGINLLISGILFTGLPSLMSTMEDLSLSFYSATQTGENNEQASSLSWSLIQENTADLLYVGTRGFSALEKGTSVKNGLSPDNFKRSNLTALVTPDVIKDVDSPELKHLEYKLDQDENGEDIAVKIKGGAFSFLSDTFEEGYFRYQANFIPIMVGLAALVVAYIFTLFVFATTIIEIGFKQVLAPFVFATDLESGQRTKMVINDIMSAFLLIAFTGLSLRIYTTFLAYLGSNDINRFVYLVAIVSATFVLIKGSNTIMRYFGIDTGVKEGFGQLAGAFALGRATVGGLKKLDSFSKGNKPGNHTKDHLAQQGEDNLSINDQYENGTASKLKNTVSSTGKGLGYMKNRGFPGMAEDVVKGAGDKTATNISGKVGKVSNGTEAFKSDFESGLSEGNELAKNNQAKWENKKGSINNSSEQMESAEQSKYRTTQNDSQSGISVSSPQNLVEGQKNASDTQKQRINQEMSSINSNPIEDEKMRVTEQRERSNDDMALSYKDIMERANKKNDSNENAEQIGNMKLNTIADKSINQDGTQDTILNTRTNATNGSTMQEQEVNQMVRPGQANERSLNQEQKSSSINNPLRQDIQQALNSSQTARNNVVQDVQGGMNTNTASTRQNVTQDVKQASSEGQTVRNNVIQDVQPTSNGGQTVRNTTVQEVQTQSVSMPQQATQRITQQLEKGGMFGISDQQRQCVIQEVQQHASGSPEMKQKVVQQLEQANIATPQQATQNIEQVMRRVRVPQETQQVVQNVLQEVQTTGNVSTQAMKQKVVQELEKADFGARESIKDLIIQDVQRSFSATPEQMTQNVKQVIDTVETNRNTDINNQEVNVTKTEKKKGYFDQLNFPEIEMPTYNKMDSSSKIKSRFEFIKGV